MVAREIRLFSKVRIHGAMGQTPGQKVVAFNLEVAALGFTLTRDMMDRLETLDTPAFLAERARLLPELISLSGRDVEHTRLFSNFPYSVPDQYAYFRDRVIGAIKNAFGYRSKSTVALSCGHIIDLEQFNMDAFGACPICQFSVPELRSPSGTRYTYRQLTPLKPVGYLSPEDAVATANRLLARPSSLSADEKAWLLGMIEEGAALSVPAKVFRESLPFVYLLGGAEVVKPHMAGATDVLRIAALLSDTSADLSLKFPVKFRLSTSHGSRLLALLESQSNLREDFLRYRERWLRFGEHLHVGAARHRRRFPRVAAAFDDLRNAAKTIETFNRQIEHPFRAKDISPNLLTQLSKRPGEFARRLDSLLRTSDQPGAVVSAARETLPRITLKLLFELDKYFSARSLGGVRIFLAKGNENRMHVAQDRRKAIDDRWLQEIQTTVRAALRDRLRTLPALGAVHVDPLLKEHLVPFNRRGDSATVSPVAKGSRYPFQGDIIRLFVHWIGHVDVDLSVLFYDNALVERGHVAFTNTQYPGCVHSGDIQDAPNGASEFIDFDIASLTSQGVRYVASSIHSYRGQSFAQFPCFAGFMQRDALRSGAVYEPQSVALKFDLTTTNTSHMPLVFDLFERKVIFADVSSGNRRHGGVHGEYDKHRILMESVLTMGQRKPTLYDVVSAHVEARGRLCDAGEAERMLTPNDLDVIMREFVDLAG